MSVPLYVNSDGSVEPTAKAIEEIETEEISITADKLKASIFFMFKHFIPFYKIFIAYHHTSHHILNVLVQLYNCNRIISSLFIFVNRKYKYIIVFYPTNIDIYHVNTHVIYWYNNRNNK